MPAKKLLYLLSREEVTEIALQVGKPPCALVHNAYRRITPNALNEDEIIAVLAAVGGREHLPGLADGRTWEHRAAVGTVKVMAAYEGNVLKASLRLIALAAAATAGAPAAVAAPAEKPAARASRRPPSGDATPVAAATSRASRKPPAAEPARASRRPAAAAAPEKRASRKPPASNLNSLSMPPGPSTRRASKRPNSAKLDVAPIVKQLANSARFSDAPIANVSELPPPPAVVIPSAQSDVASARAFGNAEAKPVVHVVTAHDAFNFEPSNPWSQRPAAFDQRHAEAPKRELPKFEGDLLDDLLGKARALRATDVHLLADRAPMLRVAGDLVAQDYKVDAARAEELVLARVPAAFRAALERDGSCDFSLIHPAYGRFRANVTRQRSGIKLTARPIGDHIPTLAELGLPESIARATHHHQGLIVITGPTGHGKTTTLAALVGIINRDTTHHVITVEDPVEYVHPRAKAVISQREVGTHTKSFQAALKGSLREDPDVIVVGELRDTETVRMALSASETGHLVISTMNTPSAAKAIERLIDLFPPGDQPQVRMTLAGGLRLIVSQRLLPNADRTGLCAAAEVLPGNLPLWNLIRENRTYQIASLQQQGKALGIVRLDESLAELVRSGRASLDVARALAEQPEIFDAIVAGRSLIQRPTDQQAPAPAARAPGPTAKAATAAVAAVTPKKASEVGKSVLSRAGKLFGSDAK